MLRKWKTVLAWISVFQVQYEEKQSRRNLYNQNRSVCLFAHVYPSSTHSFGPTGMKLGMETPWDPGGDMG